MISLPVPGSAGDGQGAGKQGLVTLAKERQEPANAQWGWGGRSAGGYSWGKAHAVEGGGEENEGVWEDSDFLRRKLGDVCNNNIQGTNQTKLTGPAVDGCS